MGGKSSGRPKLEFSCGVYITGPFEDRLSIRRAARELSSLGFVVTSRWHSHVEPSNNDFVHVVESLAELHKADVIIVIGRLSKRVMWELGYATAMGLSRVLVSCPTGHFYLDSLPIERYNSWVECLRAFTSLAKLQFKKGAGRVRKDEGFV